MPAAVTSTTTTSSEPQSKDDEHSNTNNDEQIDHKMWNALKRYIVRERQRKREEYEAEVEEERLRKEREARERQDVMTLEETKDQIEQLESKMKQLEKEKQQLFMQLKKVLNEDDVRKKQQMKENSENMSMKIPLSNIQMPMYTTNMPPTSSGQGDLQITQGRPPPLTSQMINKPTLTGVQGGIKRGRSPSPTYGHPMPYAQHRVSSHHHVQQIPKHQSVYTSQGHKPTQYNTSPQPPPAASYYPVERPPPLLYAHHTLMYPPPPQQSLYHVEVKHRDMEVKKDPPQPQVLLGLSDPAGYPPTSRHMSIHPPTINMHNNVQAAKQGSITQGYQVRQTNSNIQNPNIFPNRHRY